jgi:putative tricarboxylic transport membrane protein
MKQCPEIFWGVIASMYIGNVVLLVLNLPLVSVFASIMRIPQPLLMGVILILCLVGSFSINNSILDVYVVIGMGLLGYILKKLKFDLAPLILGLVLGPIIEKDFRQSLFIVRGDLWLILNRPITAVLLGTGLVVILTTTLLRLRRSRR